MLKNIFNSTSNTELGYGNTLGTQQGERLMNSDGSNNVVRNKSGRFDNTYYHLMRMKWWQFMILIMVSYLILTCFFASLYCLVGVHHLVGFTPSTSCQNFLEACFFSTQTLTTVGYGRIAPEGIPANIIASIESLTGLLSFAIISGLLYGRFSQPVARVVFSENMLIAPFKEGKALMFRMVNASRSELIETEVQLILSINQINENGQISRRYLPMPLEISKIAFFTLSWTIVHPIDEKSPIFGFSLQDLIDANAEIFVNVNGVDESNQQKVFTRRSYHCSEMVANAKFKPIIGKTKKGIPLVFTEKISEYELIENG
jgi:inward rectifier potassium channel